MIEDELGDGSKPNSKPIRAPYLRGNNPAIHEHSPTILNHEQQSILSGKRLHFAIEYGHRTS